MRKMLGAAVLALLAICSGTCYANSVGGQVVCAADNSPIFGVKVTITGGDGCAVAPASTEFTDADGNYIFYLGGCTGTFTICIDTSTLPPGATLIGPACITATVMDSSETFNFTVNCQSSPPCTGEIGDFVWQDTNGNGCQDAGEPGIPGVTVALYSGCGISGSAVATTTTDNTGHYLFTGLCPGTYTVSFTTPSGYTRTVPNVGCIDASNPNSDSNQLDSKCACPTGTPCGVCVQLTSASPINLNVDCGYVLQPDVLCAANTGQVGTPYSSAIVASGGCVPYVNFVIIGGSLPPGLSLDATTGVISGVPTTAGTFPYAVQVTDSCGNQANTVGENCTITITGCPACAPHDIQYNFNGTQIIFQSTPGGSYVWFISDGKVSGLPANQKVVLHISNQTITIPAVGSSPQYVIPVPDAFITFNPGVNVATTTFDTVNNVWRMTFPTTSMAGNIFYGATAFKVPAAGLPGGIKNVDWKGTFTTDTAGLKVNWQWSAANYSDFTSDYNSIAAKPTDDTSASVYKNSDHAGTPEGTDTVSGKLWKTFVVGGGSGGGGGNYTGSGSSTLSFTPCVCPTP